MVIELWRKVVATEYSTCTCAICANDFDRGIVSAWAFNADRNTDIGDVCPTCLDYLSRRAQDAKDPAYMSWPTLRDLEEARRRYPEPLFATDDELLAAATDCEADDKIYEASVVWRAEPEHARA
jgi:hypothetical protein